MKTYNNYNGFKGLIESIIQEKAMVEPSAEKFEKFISENNLEKKEFSKEVNGMKFKVVAFYINNELLKIEAERNGVKMPSGKKGVNGFDAYVASLEKALNLIF